MTEISALGLLARIAPSLGLIIGGLLLVRWFSQRSAGGRAEHIRVTSRTGLARNTSVAVVEVGAQRFLLGLTDSNVSLISELVADEASEETSTIDLTEPAAVTDIQAFRASTDRTTEEPGDLPALDTSHPWTGLVSRMQRATQRSTGQTSWQRVDDVRTG